MEFLSKYFDATKPCAFFEISCGQCKSMDDLFVEMAYVFSFPDYFWWGNRWDSLNDCMQQDLGWIDEEFISIRFSDFFVMVITADCVPFTEYKLSSSSRVTVTV